MKYLLLTTALLAAVNFATCYNYYSRNANTDTYGSSGTEYLQYIRARNQLERLRTQFETVCPDHSNELDDAIIKIKECTDEIDENTETACSAVKNHFLRCSKPMIQLLEKCLPEESNEIPALVFQSINSGINYMCKTDGEHIFELANTCVFKTNYRSMRCERRVKTKMQQFKNKPPTKTEICELAHSMKPCLQNHLQDSCGHFITREAFMGIFDALVEPCKGTSVSSNEITVDSRNNLNEVELLDKI